MRAIYIIVLSFGAAAETRREVHREIEATTVRSEASGFRSLLEMICDVVVLRRTLGHIGRISG